MFNWSLHGSIKISFNVNRFMDHFYSTNRQPTSIRQRPIKPKPKTQQADTLPKSSDITLIPKWQIIQNSKQKCTELLAETKQSSNESNKHQILRAGGPRTAKSLIQTMKPTSEPRKATLMTENGPVDVRICLSS